MEQIVEEIWKDIKGFEGTYEISNFGNVRKINKTNAYDKRTRKYFYLKGSTNKDGYRKIKLSKNKKYKVFSIHRLVAQAFIPNPNNYPVINHKDENKLNNCVNNLEWCSIYYNNNYGLHNQKVAKSNWKKIIQYDLEGNIIRKWNSIKEAGETLNIHRSNISLCLSNKYKTAGGYVWRYNYD